MSAETVKHRLPEIFWQVWHAFWKQQPEGEVPLAFVKPLMDGDFVCMAPVNDQTMERAMVGLKDDPKFEVLRYGDWAINQWGYHGTWTAFVVSTRHEFWKAVAQFDSIEKTDMASGDDGGSLPHP